MVYTITLNPALDYNISLEEFTLGKLNLADKAYFLGGGKGINVSKVLKNLGIPSKALGFLGGFTGEFIKRELKERDIEEEFVEVEGNTRVNLKIKNKELETEIAGLSPSITETNLAKLFEKLYKIEKGDILVLSGSVPKSLGTDIYNRIMKIIPAETKVILDTRGEAFRKSLEAGPYLVKPNIHELEEFCGRTFENQNEIIKGAREIMKMGAENVIVSMGGQGSMLVTKEDVYIGNVPKGTLRNSVGAGDSMVGGIVAKLYENKGLVEAYKFGIGSGSATAFSYDLCTLDEINLLLKEIEVSKY